MIVDVPSETPFTVPFAEPIVATAVVDDVHVPPVTEFESVVVDPAHVESVPAIADGAGFTVNVAVT